MIAPTATYRLQLRGNVDFARVTSLLPYLSDLGISHLYLSPIFCAQGGSTHGYDVTDPNRIEPDLGGEDGFRAMARAAQAHGLGVILDIVPNHTAFSVENPWLRDVLRHGDTSRYAGHFDIDWSQRLVLPFLERPFAEMLEAGRIGIAATDEGWEMRVPGLTVPLAVTMGAAEAVGDPAALEALHDAQPWRLTHWERERDGVTHRRFFNVTGLIGMRVEERAVFDDMHRLAFALIGEGLVQGLRVDHIDGLADPALYLQWLAEAIPDTPVWVEKILTGDEALPDWPVTGTTGYEATTMLCRVLTDPTGHARLIAAWEGQTGRSADFHAAVREAKHEVIRQDLAAELHQLIALAQEVSRAEAREHGQEALREAVIALLIAFPRYRSYGTATGMRAEDAALIRRVADDAAEGLRTRAVVDLLAGAMIAPQGEADAAFQQRFQQVTGALLAKSHEDTAAFRLSAYLAANEVGADPDDPTLTAADLMAWANGRQPLSLTLTSSHDTKRSEDARMRIAAISHLPVDFLSLLEAAATVPGAQDVVPSIRWYAVQSLLAIWGTEPPPLPERLAEHMIKALREAKEITNWTHPDEAAEAVVLDYVAALVTAWQATPPAALATLIARGAALSLVQTALKIVLPGVPDIYQSCDGEHLALTDPDNRLPVPWDDLPALQDAPGFTGDKARLTRTLLRLRRAAPDLFDTARAEIGTGTDGAITLTRRIDGKCVSLRYFPDMRPLACPLLVHPANPDGTSPVDITVT